MGRLFEYITLFFSASYTHTMRLLIDIRLHLAQVALYNDLRCMSKGVGFSALSEGTNYALANSISKSVRVC